MAAIDWNALSQYRGSSGGGGNNLNTDWLNNTMDGRSTYGRYLQGGGQAFDGVPMPNYGDGAAPGANLGLGGVGPYVPGQGQAQAAQAPATPTASPAMGAPMNSPVSQLSGGTSGEYMGSPYSQQNPYLSGAAGAITDRVTQNLQRNILPGISQASAMSGNYGGSRQGVLENNAIRDANLGLGDSLAGMYSQDWNNQQGRNLSRYQGDQGFYTAQRGQDQTGAALGASLYNQGQQGQWSPLQNASATYSPYTGLGTSSQTQNTGGGASGALGGALGGYVLGKNIWGGSGGSSGSWF